MAFVFDALDRVTSGKTQDESGGSYTDLTSVSRSYNGFSELSSETQNGSFAFSYSHAANGALDEITYPSGGPVLDARYVFDNNGRVDSVDRKLNTTVEGIGSVVWDTACATLEYEGWREIQRVQDAYDLDRTQTWTAYREPAVLRYEKDSTNALLTGLDNDWDDNGRMVARARLHDTVGNDQYGELFQYDDMDCLTHMWTDLKNPGDYLSYSVPESTAVFDEQVFYDLGKVYERKDRKVNPDDGQDQWTAHAITNNNFYQYTAVDGQAQTYDDDGQLTDNGPWAFRWTALGQLAEADPDSGTTLENEFDAFGRRVTRTAGSQVNRYVYLGWHMIGEYDETADEWLWQEIPMNRGEGMLEHIALDTNDLDDDQNTTEYRQYAVQTDFQETVWGLSDTSGAQVERYLYSDPYGVTSTEDASGTGIGDYATEVYHQKRLHGGVVDAATAVYDFRKRWMSPQLGSWTTLDPLDFPMFRNKYTAFLGAPLQVTDYQGMKPAQQQLKVCEDAASHCYCYCVEEHNELVQTCWASIGSGGGVVHDLMRLAYCSFLSRQKVVCNTPCTVDSLAWVGGDDTETIHICVKEDEAIHGDCVLCGSNCPSLILHEALHNSCTSYWMDKGLDAHAARAKCNHSRDEGGEYTYCAWVAWQCVVNANCPEADMERCNKWWGW